MPIARFQMPDGRVARFEVPEGTTPEQAQAMMAEAMPKVSSPAPVGNDGGGLDKAARDVLTEMPWLQRQAVGAGGSLVGLWEGAKQLVGKSDQEAVRLARIAKEEAPVGAIATDIAMTALPFGLAGNSLKAAGAVGAGFGALQPVEAGNAAEAIQGKAMNAAFGGAAGAGGQYVANKATGWLANKAADLATRKSQRAPLDATVKEAIDAGYVIPPGQINPSFLNRQLESIGGKIATQQMASSKNQAITDALARKAAGLTDEAPITPDTLRAARDAIKAPYQEIAGLGLQPKLNALDEARAQANAAWREYSRQGTRSALNDFSKFKAQATRIEQDIERGIADYGKNASLEQLAEANRLTSLAGKAYADAKQYGTAAERLASGKAPAWSADKISRLSAREQEAKALTEELQSKAVALRQGAMRIAEEDRAPIAERLIQEFRNARTALAKNHDVESALIEGGGSVDARAIGRMFQRGDKMTGDLRTIGSFANNFPKNVQPERAIGTPDAHNLKFAMSLLAGGGGMAGLGPVGVAAGAIPMLAGPAARGAMFSRPMQAALANPSYNVPISSRMAGGLLGYSPVGATVFGMNSLGQ